MGDREDVAVGERVGVIATDRGDVVALVLEIGGQAKRETFVEEESHDAGAAASSRLAAACTSVRAYSKHAFTSSIVRRG